MDIVVFEVGGHRYALPAADVREVVRAVTIVPLPGGPAIVEGVVDVRGTLVPVLDIRARFGLPAAPVSLSDVLVLASDGTRLVALRADAVTGLARATPALHQSAEIVAQAAYVSGVATLDDGLVLVHDVRTFLARAEADAIDRALRQPAGSLQ
jgi:purine-binding chemotaxis protein CheW